MSRKPPKKPKPAKLPRGVCRYCGCTDDAGCDDAFDGSCHWVNPTRTVCSACVNRQRTHRTRAMRFWAVLVDLGDGKFDLPDGREADAFYFSEHAAILAAKDLHAAGHACQVVPFDPVPRDHRPDGSKKP